MQNEDERDVVLTMADVVADYEHRKAGIDNDLARFAEIGSLELGKITAPTLVIVGSADTDVPPGHSDHAAAAIPGAEKIVMGRHAPVVIRPPRRRLGASASGRQAPLTSQRAWARNHGSAGGVMGQPSEDHCRLAIGIAPADPDSGRVWQGSVLRARPAVSA
jgi:pimeloyl-ACP methyl ester carboxylesterase